MTMNRKLELAHLANAEKTVAEAERHVVLQEQLVAELDRDGHDTARVLAILQTFRRLKGEHIARRDFVLKLLQQDAARLRLPKGPIFLPGYYESPRAEARPQTGTASG